VDVATKEQYEKKFNQVFGVEAFGEKNGTKGGGIWNFQAREITDKKKHFPTSASYKMERLKKEKLGEIRKNGRFLEPGGRGETGKEKTCSLTGPTM